MRITLLLAALLWAAPLVACLNDADSRRDEEWRRRMSEEQRNAEPEAGLPPMADVITGKFSRYPAEYYKKRIELSEQRLIKSPADLDAYDDAAVAYDRGGNVTKALEIMASKREAMDKWRAQFTEAMWKEHDYAYYANTGTFMAHRWFKEGSKAETREEFRRGRDMIAKSIEIKPDAHFGREKYQLQAMDWVLSQPKYEGGALPNVLGFAVEDPEKGTHYGSDKLKSAIAGIAGLIVLGTAWENIDYNYALMLSLAYSWRYKEAQLALQRCLELIGMGKKSVVVGAPTGDALKQLLLATIPRLIPNYESNAEYQSLREVANAWVTARNEYAVAQIALGRHPDTNKDFWEGLYRPEITLGGRVAEVPPVNWFFIALAAAIAVIVAAFAVQMSRIYFKVRQPDAPTPSEFPPSYLPDSKPPKQTTPQV